MPKWHHGTINPVGFAATEARYEEERKKKAKKEQAIKKEQVKDRKKWQDPSTNDHFRGVTKMILRKNQRK